MDKKLIAKLILDNKQFLSEMKKVRKEMYVLNKNLKKTKRNTKELKDSTDRLSSSWKMLTGAFAVATVAAVKFGEKALEAFDKQEKAETKLYISLKKDAFAFKELRKQAQELQKVTIYGDEATINAQAMLATLGLTEQQIRKITPLVLDFASAYGVDLATAATLVGKSIGSSTNALSRYGITIEGAAGSAERLNSAVKALNEQVGGQAEAAAKVGTGAITQLNNAFGDLMERIGKNIAESREFIALINKLKELASGDIFGGSEKLKDVDVKVALETNKALRDAAQKRLDHTSKYDVEGRRALEVEIEFYDRAIKRMERYLKLKEEEANPKVQPTDCQKGSICYAEKELAELQKQLKKATSEEQRIKIRLEIETKSGEIDFLKTGALPFTDDIGETFASFQQLLDTDFSNTYDSLIEADQNYLNQHQAWADALKVINSGMMADAAASAQMHNRMIQTILSTSVGAVQSMIATLTGGGDTADIVSQFINTIGSLLVDLGMMIFTAGGALQGLASMNPYIMIAAGLALAAIAGAIAHKKRQISRTVSYGAAAGGGYSGGGAVSYGSYEMPNTTQSGTNEFIIKGEDLVSVTKFAAKKYGVSYVI